MFEAIIDDIVQSLTVLLPSFSRIGSLVRVHTKSVDGKTVRFPVAMIVAGANCDEVAPYDLTLDSSQRGIMYFQAMQPEPTTTKVTNHIFKVEQKFRVVAWYNSEKFSPNTTVQDLASEILRNMPSKAYSIGEAKNIKIHFEGMGDNTATVFSGLTYDEARTQYLSPPYKLFTLKFNMFYIHSPICAVAPLPVETTCND
jgi:hypothetical protein